MICLRAVSRKPGCRYFVYIALLLGLTYFFYTISQHHDNYNMLTITSQLSGGLSYPRTIASNFQENEIKYYNVCSWTETAGLTPCVIRSGSKRKMVTEKAKIHLAVAACGNRADEAAVLVKSAFAYTTYSFLVIYIFSEKEHHSFFDRETTNCTQHLDSFQFSGWPPAILERAEFRLYDVTYPVEHPQNWRYKFGACASQRLFFPTLLIDVDALIYVDADSLLLTAAEKLWDVFSRFNSSQQMALVAEHVDPTIGWYNTMTKTPFLPPFGVNSGVMLMNLTRMRQANWFSTIIQYEKQYRYKLILFDQDLINIYFHFHPEALYLMDCPVNYRMAHCSKPNKTCTSADQKGVQVLHGNSRAFTHDGIFKIVHTVFRKYQLGEDLESGFYKPLRTSLQNVSTAECHQVTHIFLIRA